VEKVRGAHKWVGGRAERDGLTPEEPRAGTAGERNGLAAPMSEQ
jgi:hypothetical protein